MADYGYGNSRQNPFLPADEVDDFEFLNHPKQGSSGYMLGNEPSYYGQAEDKRRMQLQQEIQAIGERTLQSSDRALGLIHESERMGVATAEELLHQREQLQNVERKVDDVNATLKTTQKHLNSIKSIFGGIKNYFSKTPESRPPRKPVLEEDYQAENSALQGVVQQVKSETPSYTSVHPGLRIRGLDDAANDEDDDEQYWNQSSRTKPQPQRRSHFKEIEAKMDSNLDEMSAGLQRLKGLAVGLGDEITEQNEMIDRLTEKTEIGEGSITQQNFQMRRILGR